MQSSDITSWLHAWQHGDDAAFERLVPAVYAELRQLAARILGDRPSHATLQPTALVHDALLKLIGAKSIDLTDRKHFFVAMAKIMRQLLVDRVRAQRRDKRGGVWQRVDYAELLPIALDPGHDLLDLDSALTDLASADPRIAAIVELRYFGGLEVEAVAKLLEIDPRTVYRDTAFARAWLAQRLA
jgi:RNA polymerase sigma factor (TIGR02999 family)